MNEKSRGAREVTLQYALRGFAAAALARGQEFNGVTATNAYEVVRRGISTALLTAIDYWDRTDVEPDWQTVFSRVSVDGRSYVGPTGGWIEFGQEDIPILTRIAQQELDWARHELSLILETVG